MSAKGNLSAAAVREIRATKPGICPHCKREIPHVKNLARAYGLAQSTIQRIRRGVHYKKVR